MPAHQSARPRRCGWRLALPLPRPLPLRWHSALLLPQVAPLPPARAARRSRGLDAQRPEHNLISGSFPSLLVSSSFFLSSPPASRVGSSSRCSRFLKPRPVTHNRRQRVQRATRRAFHVNEKSTSGATVCGAVGQEGLRGGKCRSPCARRHFAA